MKLREKLSGDDMPDLNGQNRVENGLLEEKENLLPIRSVPVHHVTLKVKRNKPAPKTRFSIFASMWRAFDDLSATEYSGLSNDLLTYYDLLYTYGYRYDRLIEWDLEANRDPSHTYQGHAITYASQHIWLAVLTTVAFSMVAFANLRYAYNKLSQAKQERKENSYKSICDKMLPNKDESPNPLDVREAHDINYYIAKVSDHMTFKDSDGVIKQKYAKMRVNADPQAEEGQVGVNFSDEYLAYINRKRGNQKPNYYNKYIRPVINKLVNPTWEFLGISSFFYWIFWIGSAIFTGVFQSGSAAIPNGVLFPIVFGLGAIFPLIKVKNWFKNRNERNQAKENGEDPELRAIAQNDMDKVMRLARIRRDTELRSQAVAKRLQDVTDQLSAKMGEAELKAYMQSIEQHSPVPECSLSDGSSADDEIRSLGKGKWRKAATAGFATLIGAYVCAQYASWVVTDALSVFFNIGISAPVIQLGFGIALFAIAATYGIYKFIDKYNNVAKQEQALNDQLPQQKTNNNYEIMEAYYNNHTNVMNGLREEAQRAARRYLDLCRRLGREADRNLTNYNPAALSKYDKDSQYFMVDRPSQPTDWKTRGRQVYEVVNGFCTMAFVMRICLLFKTTAIFWAFAGVGAGLLSNPVTIGLVVAGGLAFGLFKLYQYNERKKEERAQKLLEQRTEHFEFLKEKTKNAPQEEMMLKMQVKNLELAVSELEAELGGDIAPAQPTPAARKGFKLFSNGASCFNRPAAPSNDELNPLLASAAPNSAI